MQDMIESEKHPTGRLTVVRWFSFVMATGIVSIASSKIEYGNVAVFLFALNQVVYLCCFIMFLWYAGREWRRIFLELINPARGFDYYSLVAGSCVLGNQFVLMSPLRIPAVVLWWLSLLLWLLFTYSIFTSLIVRRSKQEIAVNISGSWLLSVVATQAVALLGITLSQTETGNSQPLLLFLLCVWLFGITLYLGVISTISYRFLFFPVTTNDMTPPYWINMGAMAISTLTGGKLISELKQSSSLSDMVQFVKGGTLVCRTIATWWIPLLIILGCWRHLIHKVSFNYDVRFWSIVFPLGMYATATLQLSTVFDLPLLGHIAFGFTIIALMTWLITILAMLKSLLEYTRDSNSGQV
ncbi:tellurite resistance/C4-dicarboxylate transporter family protein [Gimesia sp.]|uniref:tellurite resistance/C4-dicarboxylate transporter family protein n=1 Tax=Gimesia sp. TaxID=2024833 RepID=UPI003A918C23